MAGQPAALQRRDRATALAAWQRAITAGPLDFTEPSPFVGSARCAECHSEINDEQQSSRHAQTLHYAEQVAALKLPSQTYTEPANHRVEATVTSGATPATLSIADGSEAMAAVMTYVLGSGRHAFTPIGRDAEGVLRELRLTYYSAISSWDRTPGHKAQPAERDLYLGERQTDDSLRRCLNCHTTNYRAALTRTGLEAVDRGIGCDAATDQAGTTWTLSTHRFRTSPSVNSDAPLVAVPQKRWRFAANVIAHGTARLTGRTLHRRSAFRP